MKPVSFFAPIVSFAVLVALVVFVAGCSATSGGGSGLSSTGADSWIAVETDRFEIFATIREEEARALATELERFHALIHATMSGVTEGSPVPTRIYAFRSTIDYARFATRRTGAIFMPGLRTNTILLHAPSRGTWAREGVFHEYVHYVLRNGSQVTYPVWYDEGFAELLSTALVHKDLMAVGAMPKRRIDWLRLGEWMSIERLVSGKSYEDYPGEDRSMLYAQGWALVHYLSLDRENHASTGRDLARYLALIASGVSSVSAFEEAFGESTENVGRNIRSILERGGLRVIGIPLDKLDYDRSEPRVRAVSPTEVGTRLGQLALDRRDAKRAEIEFRAALAEDPANARAEAGLGDALKDQGRWEEAKPHFDRAVELDPQDVLNHLDQGEYYMSLALEKERLAEVPELIARARDAYQRAEALDPDRVETLAMRAQTHLAPGEDPREAVKPLETALALQPSSYTIRMLLAEAHVAMGRERAARRILLARAAATGEGGVEQAIDEKLEMLRKRRTDMTERAARLESRTLATPVEGQADTAADADSCDSC